MPEYEYLRTRTTREERRHIAQYAWEGSFFIIALAACIAVIARALRAEARVIRVRRRPGCEVCGG